ncbi:MFS transporter [Pedobacter sp. SYSU D00535]|uniref:MFS transporter n=1 Tax=Pedobacter sp. SYSU D00535 TaxID=2810308 RepID=UPI001A959733|nr:MFS transporter [Pedobacter sp. SYSU D00535]
MKFKPSESLSEKEVQSGLRLVIADGLFAESMVSFTGGAFLVAMAIHLGATNFQLGVLAALPTFSSIFQLVSVWLVRQYNNRKAITVIFSFLARFPLFVIGLLPFLFSTGTSIYVLIFFLFFHYYFGSVAGAAWNSWMRDLIPTQQLGTYFSHRSRLTQSLNVILSLTIAFCLDYLKAHYPEHQMLTYSGMFLVGGVFGMLGIYMLARTPEPQSVMVKDNMFKLLQMPLRDKNFRKLLAFNSFWAFSLNLATPFFSVYMMKTLNIELSFIIALGIVCQLSSIFSIKMWGRLSDRFSNKTIIRISAPVYILCILSWAFTGMADSKVAVLGILVLINIFSGISTAGANLAIGNVGMKLAPRNEAIVYLSVKNMMVAFFAAIAPVIGGLMADFFATHELIWSFEWKGAEGTSVLPLIALKGWSFFFIIGGLLAMLSLRLLSRVREEGEVQKDRVVFYMRSRMARTVSREARAVYSGESFAGLKKAVGSWTVMK